MQNIPKVGIEEWFTTLKGTVMILQVFGLKIANISKHCFIAYIAPLQNRHSRLDMLYVT